MNTSQHLARLGYPGEVGWRLLPADPRLVRNTIPAATVGVYLFSAARIIAWQPHATPEWAYRIEYKWYLRLHRKPGVLNKITPAAPGALPATRGLRC